MSAATALFLDRGYGRTSLTDIATTAGVVVQTVYNSVGNKAALLSAVLDAVAAGRDAPTPVPTLMRERAAHAADAAAVVELLADWFVDVNARAARLWAVIAEAAATDADVAALKQRRDQGRRHNYREAAAELRRRGALRPGITDDEAASTIWSLGHPVTYSALVLEAGWSAAAYRKWIHGALTGALLDPASTTDG